MIKILSLILLLIMFSFAVGYAAFQILDPSKEIEYRNLKIEAGETVDENFLNTALDAEIIETKKRLLKSKVEDIGLYTGSLFSNGNEDEIDKIWKCVFP